MKYFRESQLPIMNNSIWAKSQEGEDDNMEDDNMSEHDDERNDGFDDSSNNKSSTDTYSGIGTVDDDNQNIKDALSRKESKQVFRLRVLVILILILVALSISLTVFWLERNAQIAQFEAAYYGVAGKIIDSLEEVTETIAGLSALAIMAAVESRHHEQEQVMENVTFEDDTSQTLSSWPRVTIDRFQERANNVRSLSRSIFVSVNPIVEMHDLIEWEKYVQSDANTWIAEGLQLQKTKDLDRFAPSSRIEKSWLTGDYIDPMHTFDTAGIPHLSAGEGPYVPRWQTSPVLPTNMVNENLLENPAVSHLIEECIAEKSVVLGGFHTAPPGSISHPDFTTSHFATLLSMWEGEEVIYDGDPVSHIAIPIFDASDGKPPSVVGVIESTMYWRWFMKGILPPESVSVTVVIGNECTGNFTYQIDGPKAHAIGAGDRHDNKFSFYRVDGFFNVQTIEDGTARGIPFYKITCPYHFHVYPTDDAYTYFVTNQPVMISLGLAIVFAFTIGMFLIYDGLVERRQRLLLAKATKSTAIVSSLFPKQVRQRLLAIDTQKKGVDDGFMTPANPIRNTFLDGNSQMSSTCDQPIADFFPSCTVFFADIAGFTAWSSTREPTQVFMLLQTVYQNFDAIAKRRKVFKVETIGDSYVAVTGLPEPQPKHAIIMVRFAWDCLLRMGEITKELESTLGPDTNDLTMRFGLHSGSVTAGVLKGDRARFQLFGDTVNTASRMESTGVRGRIQVSEETAELLRNEGKGSWLSPRVDRVHAKGKGTLTTYWVTLKNYCSSNTTGSSEEEQTIQNNPDVGRTKPTQGQNSTHSESCLIDWMTNVLLQHISTIVAVRQQGQSVAVIEDPDLVLETPKGPICLDEVQDAIPMPEFNPDVANAMLNATQVDVPNEIAAQLRAYVALVARSYRHNPFHNFEHACHVVMSVSKLLRRIVVHDATSNASSSEFTIEKTDRAVELHNFTYGLTSDPMAFFALLFSALIHDVDHQGISNDQLIREEPALGEHYRNRCVAEQNAIDVAWDLLMSQQFVDLRRYIFASHDDLMRFRRLIVNHVMATDIFDKENGQRRRARWEKAFQNDGSLPQEIINNLRATIIMEHIMQASDVSHTMQHWHVYIKWNRKLFTEMFQAWKTGRMSTDPSEFWYKGELAFLDNYVIPLAKKLRECNVFGVSSDEYLGYALRNRAEWEERGEDMVKSMIAESEAALGIATVVEGATEEGS